jgi:hypothetical protein
MIDLPLTTLPGLPSRQGMASAHILGKNLKLDWKNGVLPALRTAGALMIGNAGVTYLMGSTKYDIALTMLVIGTTMVFVCSLNRI